MSLYKTMPKYCLSLQKSWQRVKGNYFLIMTYDIVSFGVSIKVVSKK